MREQSVMETVPIVRKAVASDMPQLSQMLARAFKNDRIAKHVLPDDDLRQQGLERIYRLYFKVFLPHGACYTSTACEGAALWLPPGAYPLSLVEHLRLLPGMAGALGLARLPRALSVLDHLEKMHPLRRKYWYLGVLGVEPDHQNRGIGSRLIQPVLAVCNDNGLGAYLETATESNLRFYAEHGFKVMHEFRIPNGPGVWGLWRDPG
jgi:GNAT superfamily N-acetyltransferase